MPVKTRRIAKRMKDERYTRTTRPKANVGLSRAIVARSGASRTSWDTTKKCVSKADHCQLQ